MVDRANRDALAELIRHLVAGRITNDEFTDNLPQSRDRAVFEVFWNGVWGLYDDLYEHRLTGRHYIPRNARTDVARCVLFLKGDLEYEWSPYPPRPQALAMLLSLVTLGLANRLMFSVWKKQGEFAVWPFLRRQDYECALREPPYLARAS